jgi:hypothetical protein
MGLLIKWGSGMVGEVGVLAGKWLFHMELVPRAKGWGSQQDFCSFSYKLQCISVSSQSNNWHGWGGESQEIVKIRRLYIQKHLHKCAS